LPCGPANATIAVMTGVAAYDLGAYFLFMLAATSVLSLPLAPATLLAVKTCPPEAVALAGALAAACAAVFDHHFIRRAFRLQRLGEVRRWKLFQDAERWAKVAPFLTIVAFAGFPLPFLIVRVLMPLSGYPLARYAGAVAIGRFLRLLLIAMFGTVVAIPDEMLLGLLLAGVLAAAAGALVRHLRARRTTARAKDTKVG
jgi:hypothetical protein